MKDVHICCLEVQLLVIYCYGELSWRLWLWLWQKEQRYKSEAVFKWSTHLDNINISVMKRERLPSKNIKHFVAELQDSKIDETKLSFGETQHMIILFNAFIWIFDRLKAWRLCIRWWRISRSGVSILCSEAPVQCCYESAPLWWKPHVPSCVEIRVL